MMYIQGIYIQKVIVNKFQKEKKYREENKVKKHPEENKVKNQKGKENKVRVNVR